MIRTMLADSLKAVVAQRLLPAQGGGRVAAFEILTHTPAVAHLIRENKISPAAFCHSDQFDPRYD